MGACLTPTAAMTPWYNVEVSSSHAELTATTYIHGWYRIREERQEHDAYTDEERAGAWLTLGPATFATPAAPVEAFLATLDQITEHPDFDRWEKAGGTPTPAGISAERREDGRVQITGPFHRHPEDGDGEHLQSIEILFSDIRPLRDAVAALA